MKIKSLIMTLGLALSMVATAQNYCLTAPFGYGSSATGGKGKSVTLVTSSSGLQNAIKNGSGIYIITQSITLTDHLSGSGSNFTLMALPGVTLTSTAQNKDNSGILYLKGSNIILRNLTFVGPGAYDCNGWDNLCLDGSNKVWIDHCDFQDGCDGNFDIKGTSDNITISWCRFRYLKTPKSGGSGGTDDHRFSDLLGSDSSDKPSDGTYNITWAYCWWDQGCVERMPRCRNAYLHFLNCYWNSSVAHYYIGPENTSAYIEGCYFAKASSGKVTSSKYVFYENYGGTNYASYVNSYSQVGFASSTACKSTPGYSYTAETYTNAKTYVTNTTCGAGATLTVTNTGDVSSSCSSSDSGDQGGSDSGQSGTVTSSTFWNFSDSDFSSLGTLSSNATVRNLTVTATSAKTVVVESNSKSCDGINFTTRLKSGGAGSYGTYRSLDFNVTGPCVIDVYAMSASSTESRDFVIASSSTNVLQTNTAATTLQKFSYSYTGGAAKLSIYASNSGVNFYGVRVSYYSSTGLNQTENEAKWNVSNDEISYSSDVQKIVVYDFAGHCLVRGTVFTPYLNISGLQSGNYVAVALLPNGKVTTIKFSKR